jgi:transposase
MCVECNKNKRHLLLRYKRLAARLGKKHALVATAAEMHKVIYHMLKDDTVYHELGSDYMDDKRKQAQIKYYQDQIKKLTGEDSPGKESA